MNNLSKPVLSKRALILLLVFICIIIGAAVLKIAAIVFLPLTIAGLLALVFFPLVKMMDKLKFPRAISAILIVIIIVSSMYLFGMLLYTSGRMFFIQIQEYEESFLKVYGSIAEVFDIEKDEGMTIWENLWGQEGIRTFATDITISFSKTSLQLVSMAVLIVLFMVFILLEAAHFKDKLVIAFKDKINKIDEIGNDIVNQITRYLGAKFLFSLANGIIYVIGFSIIKLDFAIVWGLVQFLLNFIPTLGSIVAGVGISIFALIQFWPNPGPIIAVVVLILSVNLILSNILDPKIIGDRVGVSPVIILLSLSIWGYIWGFAGMVLAVPMTVIIKIICENIPMMEPLSILIGSRKSVKAKKRIAKKNETKV